MARLKLINLTTDEVEIRIIPLTADSSIIDPSEELYSLDSVGFEYGVKLKGEVPFLPVIDDTVEVLPLLRPVDIIDIVGTEEEIEEI